MTGDGSDTTLSLSINPVNENNTQVFIDGVYQNKDTYSISGTTLTFSTAPPTGSAVEVMTMTQTEINVPVDGTITPAKIASGDFYFDTDTLYVDATNNNVGIGTSSPNSYPVASNLVVDAGTNGGITVKSGTSNYGGVFFADGTTGNEQYRGFIQYNHNYVGSTDALLLGTAGSERLRILSTGGITFNGDTAQANALDDYEEGTWTPNLATGSATFSNAEYVKVGKIVTLRGKIVSITDRTSASPFRLQGLPFSAKATDTAATVGFLSAHTSSIGAVTGAYFPSSTDVLFYNTSSGGFTSLQHNHLNSSGATIFFAITYITQ